MLESCNVKVSIIIPMYNEEKTIERCIKSIVAQSLKEVEILCCDDGSTDNTLDILERLKANTDNLIILHQANLGAGPARNKCLDIARGECVCFLDADDYYLDESALEKMYTEMKCNSVDMACGLMQFSEEGRLHAAKHNRVFVEDGNCKVIDFKDYQYDFYFQCYMFNREIIEQNRLRFMPLWRYQDPPFLVEYFNFVQKYVVVPVEFYGYQKSQNKFKYDFKRVRDLLLGLKYELEIAIKNDYKKLEKEILYRVNDLYAPAILSNVEGKVQILKLLVELNNLLDENEVVLDVLRFLTSNTDLRTYSSEKILYKLEKKIPIESDIIVYGAGNVGTECAGVLNETPKYNFKAWIDKYKAGEKKNGLLISGINDISRQGYDYILIAILNNDVAQEVKTELLEKGIEKRKIVLWNE